MELYHNERDPLLESRGWKALPIAYDVAAIAKPVPVEAFGGGTLAMLDVETLPAGPVHHWLRADGPQSRRSFAIDCYAGWIRHWRTNLPPGTKVGQWSTPVVYPHWSDATKAQLADSWAEILPAIGADVMFVNGYDRKDSEQPDPADVAGELAALEASIDMADRVQARCGLPYCIGLWNRQRDGRPLAPEETDPIVRCAVRCRAIGIVLWSSDHWMIGRCWEETDEAKREAARRSHAGFVYRASLVPDWDQTFMRPWLLLAMREQRRSICAAIERELRGVG